MLYKASLYVHIVGALVLFSAVGIELMCLTNLRKAGTRDSIIAWLNNFSILRKFFTTAFFFLLISGIYMMIEIWQTAAFAIIGIIGLLALSISGGAFSGKRLAAIGKSAVQGEAELPLSELILKVRDKYFWNSFLIRLFTALGLVFIMTFKTDLIDSIIAVLIAIFIGFATGKISKSAEVLQEAEV